MASCWCHDPAVSFASMHGREGFLVFARDFPLYSLSETRSRKFKDHNYRKDNYYEAKS